MADQTSLSPRDSTIDRPLGDAGDSNRDHYRVRLEGFEGPLDLLLELARHHKIDLKQISILKLAEQYLGQVDLTLLEVAYLLGFADPSNFFRAFRRWFGETPGEYRSRRGLVG